MFKLKKLHALKIRIKNTDTLVSKYSKHTFSFLAIITLGVIIMAAGEKSNQNKLVGFIGANTFPTLITTENSDLPSNEVKTIFIDSTDVAWIGTDNGLARFDGTNWIIYSTENHLKHNTVNDISFELSGFGNELWIASDSGVTVAAFDIDGITEATTYTSENSDIVGNKVNAVMIDAEHTRWIGTESAINVFKGSDWHHKASAPDAYGDEVSFIQNKITDIASYQLDSQAFITTNGNGIVRIGFNDIDGFTGASTYVQPWASLTSDQVTSVAVDGEIQWYGTTTGALYHPTHQTKGQWDWYTVEGNNLIDNYITDIHIDKENNIWFGTKQGLNILNENGDLYLYTEAQGLVNNTINVISSDTHGNTWIGTKGGIEWFDYIPGVLTSSNHLNIIKDKIEVYPNPANHFINVEIIVDRPQQVRASIYNSKGQLIEIPFNQKVRSNNQLINIDISNRTKYQKGIYIIRVDTEDYNQISKITVY